MRTFALAALSAFICGIAVLPASASVETQTASLPVLEARHLRDTAHAHLGRPLTQIDADAKEALRRSMREMQSELVSTLTVVPVAARVDAPATVAGGLASSTAAPAN